MDKSDVLMLTGTVAQCPDCGDERILVPVDLADAIDGAEEASGAFGHGATFCCTTCDAAVVVLDEVDATSRRVSWLLAS
jgi:hypothetical protein